MKLETVEELVSNLREMADFLEKNGHLLPDPAYDLGQTEVKIYVTEKEKMLQATNALKIGTGVNNPVQKNMNSYSYDLRRHFGKFGAIEVWSARDTVCEKKVVGTKEEPVRKSVETGEMRTVEIVEYECHPLLK